LIQQDFNSQVRPQDRSTALSMGELGRLQPKM